jgi:hypothetical protein
MADGGTSIASLETGNVADKADNALMNQILAEIGNAGGEVGVKSAEPTMAPAMSPPMGGIPTYSPHDGMPVGPPGMMHMPPGYMYNQMPRVQTRYDDQYDEDEEMQERPSSSKNKLKVKKNFASALLEFIRDPLLVAVLITLLSLPVLHTHIGRYVPLLYSAGGMLSWIGLMSVGLAGAFLFILFRSIFNLF